MPNRNIGLLFERDIIKSAKAYNMHVFKIPTNLFGSFGVVGVYDIICVFNGIPVGIECKATATPGPFIFSIVKPHQVDALVSLQENGGRGYILFNIRGKSSVVYVIPILEFLRLRQEYLDSGRKSIPLKDLNKLETLPKTKNPRGYDLRKLFE